MSGCELRALSPLSHERPPNPESALVMPPFTPRFRDPQQAPPPSPILKCAWRLCTVSARRGSSVAPAGTFQNRTHHQTACPRRRESTSTDQTGTVVRRTTKCNTSSSEPVRVRRIQTTYRQYRLTIGSSRLPRPSSAITGSTASPESQPHHRCHTRQPRRFHWRQAATRAGTARPRHPRSPFRRRRSGQ